MLHLNRLIESINAAECKAGEMVFWWLGQLGYAIKIAGKVIYIDAYLTDSPARRIPPPIKASEITNADIVMGTHDHIDHIDREAWTGIAKASPQAVFVVPSATLPALAEELHIPAERFAGLNDGGKTEVKGLEISAVASAHEFLDQDPETGLYPYLGYIVSDGKLRFYHSGDTCIYEGLLSKLAAAGPFDAVFIPINGRDAVRLKANCLGNMTFQEAVDLAGALRPGLTVPGHYEMFAFNSEDPQKFADYFTAKYPGLRYWIGNHLEEVRIAGRH